MFNNIRTNLIKKFLLTIACAVFIGGYSFAKAASSDKNMAEDHIFAAKELFEAGEVDAALKLAQSLYDQQNSAPSVVILLGRIYESKGSYETALEYLQKASSVMQEEGAKEIANSRHEGALAAFNRMKLELLRSRANVNLELLRCDEAEADTEQLARMQGMENSAKAFGSSMKGECLQKSNDYALAAESFENAYGGFEQHQLKDEAAYNAALMYAKTGNEEKSVEWLLIPLKNSASTWKEKALAEESFKKILETAEIKELLSNN